MENTIISSVNRVKHLGIHIDVRLEFDNHVGQICKKASKKLHVLSRVSKYMDINKRRIHIKIMSFKICLVSGFYYS